MIKRVGPVEVGHWCSEPTSCSILTLGLSSPPAHFLCVHMNRTMRENLVYIGAVHQINYKREQIGLPHFFFLFCFALVGYPSYPHRRTNIGSKDRMIFFVLSLPLLSFFVSLLALPGDSIAIIFYTLYSILNFVVGVWSWWKSFVSW